MLFIEWPKCIKGYSILRVLDTKGTMWCNLNYVS